MAPILVILLAAVLDMGGFAVQASAAVSAADAVARAVEEDPGIGADRARALVEATYPSLAGSVDVEVAPLGRESSPVGYKVYSPQTGSFKERPSEVAADTYEVSVSYRGRWFSPALMAASKFTDGDGTYAVGASAVATVDATLEVW